MTVYFLTGASGAVGSAIVPRLLAGPASRVRLLLRADSDAHLAARLAALQAWWSLPAGDAARIEALRGDAAEPRFALSAEDYARIASDTGIIIHCAASVRMNQPLPAARRSAVGSAREVLALAGALRERGTLRKVELVSTVGVAGLAPGPLPERWADRPRPYHNTYEQAKAEAEELARAAVERDGLPVTVHRPSMVIGAAGDGRIIHHQIFYHLCEFLAGARTHGVFPAMGGKRLDVAPVDWVADVIVRSSADPGTASRILHLCAGPQSAPLLADLGRTVRTAFAARGLPVAERLHLPPALFAAATRTMAWFVPPATARALATLPVYLGYLAGRQDFANDATLAWCAAQGLPMPPPETAIARALARYLDGRRPDGAA